jgi:large subunit ribosomal protein L13
MKKSEKVKNKEDRKSWFLVDAKSARIGRIATVVSKLLQGKNRVYYKPNIDTGDYVIIINAGKVDVYPKRLKRKVYFRHSGYPGGLKQETLQSFLERKPAEVIRKAVAGMLPKTKLGKAMIKKLFVYADEQHKHDAQKPILVDINTYG